jgi:hypothetical protein
MQAGQPPNVYAVGGTGNLTFTVAPQTVLMTNPPPASSTSQHMPPPQITFDEVRGKPSFRRWMKMNDGDELEYGSYKFQKGNKGEEVRLLKRLITLTANSQNKKKYEVLVAMLGRKEVRVKVSVGAAKKRHIS